MKPLNSKQTPAFRGKGVSARFIQSSLCYIDIQLAAGLPENMCNEGLRSFNVQNRVDLQRENTTHASLEIPSCKKQLEKMLKESVASLKCRTGKGKEVGVEVAVSGTSTTKSAGQNRCRVTKIAFAVLVVALLLGGVISVVIIFQQKRSSTRLADVHLEEGDTLVYRVDQNLEVRGGHIQKGNISSMVGIQVLNKTSDEYWFIIKINITIKSGSVGVKGLTAAVMDYFLVRLQISDPRSDTVNAHGDNGTNDEPFELYGNQTTDEEFIRFVYGVLDQLLPVVRRDLYEEVNGIKGNTDKKPRAEKSPLLPGGVRMHRAANTSDKKVYIKNRFDRTDLVNASSEIDMDMRYSGSASINKSNGMVSESHAYLSERLYFGESIRTKSGSDVTMMDIAFSSHVSLIETNSGYFTIGERAQIANLGLFVKLIVRAEASVSVDRKPDWDDDQFNSSRNLSNDSVFTQGSSTPTTPPSPVKRSRRSHTARNQGWNKLNKQSLQKPVDITRTLFEKKVVGIKVKGGVRLELRPNNNGGFYMTVSSTLSFGSYSVRLFRTRHDDREIKSGKTRRVRYNWEKGISIEVPVYFLSLGVEVSLWIPVTIELSFPRTSPHNLAVQIEPSVAVTTSIKGYVSVFFLRGGIYGDGTLVRASLPVTLSYQAHRGRQLCLALSARVTALELEAGIFYQWKSCRFSWFWITCDWGDRKTLISFGRWAAFKKQWKLAETCF